jgi:hypothetical protein
MNTEWIATVAAAGTLLGAGLGGLLVNLGGKRQFQRQRNWQRDQFLQEKLEDIARLAEEIDDICRSLYGSAVLLVENRQPLNFDRSIPLARLKTRIDFYAPELHPYALRIVEIRDSVGNFLAEALSSRALAKEERQQLNLQFLRGTEQMTQACEALAGAAAQLARERLGLQALHTKRSEDGPSK